MAKKQPPKQSTEDDFITAVSVTDCTGLMPRPPLTEDEYESYQEILNFAPPSPENLPKGEKK